MFLVAGSAAAFAFFGHFCCDSNVYMYANASRAPIFRCRSPVCRILWGTKEACLTLLLPECKDPAALCVCTMKIDLGINDVCRNVDTGVEQRPELVMLSVTTAVAMNGRGESGARVDCAMRCGAGQLKWAEGTQFLSSRRRSRQKVQDPKVHRPPAASSPFILPSRQTPRLS